MDVLKDPEKFYSYNSSIEPEILNFKTPSMPKYEYQKEDNRSYGTLSTRDKVFALETWMKEQPQLNLKVVNYFSYGVYARELHIPAGTLLTGEIHKFENFNILSQGEISVLTEDGMKRVEAPFSIVSPPGTKRIAFAHTDCIWTTIHGTFEKDVDKIKEMFIAFDEVSYLNDCGQLELGLQ
jgi:hypothetical protein